jgi:hypothetical protein
MFKAGVSISWHRQVPLERAPRVAVGFSRCRWKRTSVAALHQLGRFAASISAVGRWRRSHRAITKTMRNRTEPEAVEAPSGAHQHCQREDLTPAFLARCFCL